MAPLDIIIPIASGLLLVLGLVGVFLPALPGIPLALAGFVLYSWGTGFEKISLTTTIVFAAICVFIMVLDLVAQLLGAKKMDVSKAGQLGVALGTIAGLFFMPWGILVGPALGGFIGEFIHEQDVKHALKAALGAMIGTLCTAVIKVILIIVMIGFFVVALVR
ncbi:MAG: DUF456 domain-containing protein [Dehalococcoidales bacterium]|nr:DUF456 domain-containing protein [Dehalococcoidales bacterium]